MINIGGSTFIPKDNFIIDKNKLEERDSGMVTVFNTREERYEPYDLVVIEVGTEQETTFSSLGANNLITESFVSSNIETDPQNPPLFVFDSVHNVIPPNIEELYLQFEWNQNFLFRKQALFGGGVTIFSGIIFFEQQGQDFVGVGNVNLEDIFENEVYGNATIDVPENASHFTVRLVSISTNPQGLQFQQLFLNSNETTFIVSIQDITVISFQQMLVQSDTVIKNRDGLFEHEIRLIEVVAKFDGFYPADRIISSTPPKTLGEVLDIYKRELELYHNLKIDWNRRQAWTNRPVRQKEFVGVNFSVIIQDLFRTIDAIPRVVFEDNVWFIFPDFYNERKNLITPEPVSQIQMQDSLDYATRVKTQIKNGVYERSRERFFPSENGFVLPKSTTPQQIDSRLQYVFDSGIIQITEAIIPEIELRYTSGGIIQNIIGSDVQIDFTAQNIDITDFIVPKEQWDGLKTPVNQTEEGFHKKNSLFFEIGDRFVGNLFNPGTEQLFFNFSGNVEVLQNAIVADAYRQNIDMPTFTKIEFAPRERIKIKGDLNKVAIRFKYIPQRNIDIVHHRQYLKNMNEITQIHKQRDSIIDVERYKNSLKNLSNRMGNDIKQYSQVFRNFEPYELGDYDENNNVIVRVKNTFYNDYILSEYMMAESFGNIDGEISLWKEPSAFDILSKDITTNIIIEEFIEVSEVSKAITTRLTDNAIKSVLATFDSEINPEPPVQAAIMRPVLAVQTEVSTQGLYLPVFTGGGGNTNSFHLYIDDNISAGRVFSDTFVDRFAQELVYTYQEDDFLGDFGELRDFRFYLVSDVGFEDDGFYPLVNADNINDFEDAALTQTNVIDTIDKDKNAKFAVTFQQHLVTDNQEIIIGPAFSKYNRLQSDIPLPQKQVYTSSKPYSVFDERVRSFDNLSTGSWVLNESERKISIVVTPAKYVALTYNNEIVLAFNWPEEKTEADYYINFVAQAERNVINQLATPALSSFTTTPNTIEVVIENTEDEPVELAVNLFATGATQTESVGAGGTATFTFTSLVPNRTYSVNAKALPVSPSEKIESAIGVYQILTPILPTNAPVFSENSVELQAGNRYDAKYNVTNNNNFPVNVFARVNGFEYSIGSLSANSTEVLTVNLSDDNQFIFANIPYSIDMRFRTTTQQNNWFSTYADAATLLITKLDTPTFVSSSVTDETATFVWRNNSDRTVQIEMDLFAELPGINVFIEKKTGFVLAGLTSTQTFTGLDPQTTYKTTAKALQVGFRLDSDLSGFSPSITTLEPTTSQPSISIGTRTVNSIQFTFTNTDSSDVDIYWNLSGNPGPGDNVIEDVEPGDPATATATQLNAGEVYTIFWRAQAANKLISSIGQSTTATLNQLTKPNFGFASTTTSSINSQWGNPNNVAVVMETILQIGASPVPDTVKNTNISANGDASVLYEDLGANTSYNIVAKFLGDANNEESPTENSGVITTDQIVTIAPDVINVSPQQTSVSFTMVNQDPSTVTVEWGLGAFTNSQTLSTSSTTGFGSLTPDTEYTLLVRATATGKATSQTVEVTFTTLP